MSNGLRTSAAIAAWALMVAGAAPGAALAQDDAGGLGGTAIPGLCFLSQPAVLANAKVGVAATAHLRELAQPGVDALNAERKALQSDAAALNAQKASLSSAELQQREQALAQRAAADQAKLQSLNQQVDATRVKIAKQILEMDQPIVAQVYQAHGCGLLANREIVMGGNVSNDLTPAVIQGLDAKITTISFDLEPPPAPPGTAAGGAGGGAAPSGGQ